MAALRVRVVRMSWEAEGVVSVVLADPGGAPLPHWEPGAHLDVELGGLTRQYSLCGDERDRHSYTVAVLREEHSHGGSHYVHDRLRVGDEIGCSAPRNRFALVDAPRYLFIAGGIGITPIVPMVARVRAAGLPFRLLHGGRNRAGMAFRARFADLDGVSIVPEDERGLLPLDDALAAAAPGTAVYCCGPERLLDAVTDACARRGLPPDALHVERFRAPRTAIDAAAGRVAAGKVEVECRRSGVTVTAAVGEPLLPALLAAGVPVLTSCEEGICGTCEVRVLDGAPLHRDHVLNAAERAARTRMMVCVSGGEADRLVLDL